MIIVMITIKRMKRSRDCNHSKAHWHVFVEACLAIMMIMMEIV
jgi:hypothetical protein